MSARMSKMNNKWLVTTLVAAQVLSLSCWNIPTSHAEGLTSTENEKIGPQGFAVHDQRFDTADDTVDSANARLSVTVNFEVSKQQYGQPNRTDIKPSETLCSSESGSSHYNGCASRNDNQAALDPAGQYLPVVTAVVTTPSTPSALDLAPANEVTPQPETPAAAASTEAKNINAPTKQSSPSSSASSSIENSAKGNPVNTNTSPTTAKQTDPVNFGQSNPTAQASDKPAQKISEWPIGQPEKGQIVYPAFSVNEPAAPLRDWGFDQWPKSEGVVYDRAEWLNTHASITGGNSNDTAQKMNPENGLVYAVNGIDGKNVKIVGFSHNRLEIKDDRGTTIKTTLTTEVTVWLEETSAEEAARSISYAQVNPLVIGYQIPGSAQPKFVFKILKKSVASPAVKTNMTDMGESVITISKKDLDNANGTALANAAKRQGAAQSIFQSARSRTENAVSRLKNLFKKKAR